MTRVLHTADTHIGYRQYHSDDRRRDFLAAFERVVDDAIDGDVDAVVHAGDLFHDKRPDLRDLQGTVACLARLRRADVPFLGIVGNHERKRDGQWLDLFEDLGLATRLTPSATTVDDVAVYGLDYASPAQRDRLGVTFEGPADAEAHLLVGHGIVEGVPHGTWSIGDLIDGAGVRFDAVLLGDYHEHEVLHVDDVPLTYPGSTERASADERDPRGYNLVTVDGGDVAITHRAIPETRPFRYVDVDLGPDEGVERVRARLDEHDLADAVVVVTITGEGERVPPAAVEDHAREAGAIVARVRDRRSVEGTTDEVSVHFGDPDAAVRRSLDERPLSQAARELDEIVRDLDVPKSQVRERARERVAELLEESPAALEPGEERADGDPEAEPAPAEPAEEVEASAAGAGQASMEDYL